MYVSNLVCCTYQSSKIHGNLVLIVDVAVPVGVGIVDGPVILLVFFAKEMIFEMKFEACKCCQRFH